MENFSFYIFQCFYCFRPDINYLDIGIFFTKQAFVFRRYVQQEYNHYFLFEP